MAYQKGEVKIQNTYDTRVAGAYTHGEYITLPHSCDDWIIGTEENARQLIADLQALLTPPTAKAGD